jgi:DNA-binding LytR/AlgR family response regulator
MNPRAVIAEDEPLLAAQLEAELRQLWPQLRIAALAANGIEAMRLIREHAPDIVFLDIRMPGASGLEVAAEIADALDFGERVPHIVFVTAYDEYALKAFDYAAVDYLLKPVTRERLAATVERLKLRLADAARAPAADLERLVAQMRALLPAAAPGPAQAGALRHIRAGSGNTVRMIPIEEVCYFQASDKYVNVVTGKGEALVRASLKELLEQLPADKFRQIHRGAIVNLDAVAAAVRDDSGRLHLQLRERKETLPVSRVFADLFKQM